MLHSRSSLRGVLQCRRYIQSLHFSTSRDNDYCAELVQSRDYEGFLVGLLYPREQKKLYFAIRAFNVEIASIKDNTPRNSIAAARLRFQFWRDVLSHIQEQAPLPPTLSHPVASALVNQMRTFNLNTRWLERCLEARLKDCSSRSGFETMSELEDYAEYSQSSLLYLLLESLGINQADNEDMHYAASHLGVCVGIVTLLRGFHHHASQGESIFPREVMLNHGLSDHVIIRGPQNEKETAQLQDTVNDVASQAFAHLSKARDLTRNSKMLPKQSKYAFLQGVGCDLYLTDLERGDFVPFPPATNNLMVHLRMLKFLIDKKI